MALLTIKHSSINSGNPVFIQAKGFSATYNKKSMADPNANYSEDTPVVRVQSKNLENPVYTIIGVVLYDSGDTIKGYTALTVDLLKDFLVLANDDSDPIILNYTDDNSINYSSLQKYSGSRTTDIPVTMNNQVKVDSEIDSSRAKLLTVSTLLFTETKKV